MSSQKYTFCRICEPHCPLVANIDDTGKITRLSPDLQHPSGGMACHKGLSYLHVHNDPDRLNWPLQRLNPRTQGEGEFVECDWDTSLDDIAARLRGLQQKYGSNAVAVYMGNPWSFDATALLMGMKFQGLLGTDMCFSASTQDSASRFTVNGEVYGSAGALMVPDLNHTDYLLCLGGNPKVSRWLGASIPNDGLDIVKQIVARGGKVRFVNPRITESSTLETGPTVQIRPGTDVYFLAAVLNEIDRHDGFDKSRIDQYGKNLDGLRAFIRQYPAERVVDVTGVQAAVIKEVAQEIMQAKSAVVYLATGLNQSRQGVLANWLTEMINFCTGNLGREGGSYKPNGLKDSLPRLKNIKKVETTAGTLELPDPIGFAAMPATLLPDLIEGGDIKALIIYGGNPLLSIGGEHRLRQAFEKLELMVTLDIYRSASAEMCDYVLPATDWLERMDINLLANGCQAIPYVQYTDAIVEPLHGRRDGWWILAELARKMGMESPLNDHPDLKNGADLISRTLAASGLTINDLRAAPSQTVVFAEDARDSLYERCLRHPDKKIDCYPPRFIEKGLIERCARIFAELEQESADTLKIVSLRTPYIQNSWFSNLSPFRRGMRAGNPLYIGEQDAKRRGLHTGDTVRVVSKYGEIQTEIFVSDEVREGTVAMSHGSGHQKSFGLRVANMNPGSNYNALLPTGADAYEPLSHMSWITGIPVVVERLTPFQADSTGENDVRPQITNIVN